MTHKRVVLDTNVCLDLFVFDDARCGWLHRAMQAGEVQACTSSECRQEWWQVLARPKPGFAASLQAQARQRHQTLVQCIDPAEPSAAARLPRCADSDDQKFLVLARNLGACALLSRDKALLVLSRRTLITAGFVVMTPEQFTSDWLQPRQTS